MTSDLNPDLPVTFTPNALKELLKLTQDLKLDDNHFLRVGIKGGGCAGFAFLLAFDKLEDTDKMYIYPEFSLIINKAHVMHVLGMEIDYEDSHLNQGFVFQH